MNVVLTRTIEKYYKNIKHAIQHGIKGDLTLEQRIGIIGIGNMGEALTDALIKSGYPNNKIYASHLNKTELDRISTSYGINTSTNNNYVLENSDVVIVCVKPQDFQKAVETLTVKKDVLYISIAAGITMENLTEMFGYNKRIVRVIPNIGMKYRTSATAYVMGKNCI